MADNKRLFGKYIISKADGSEVDPKADYFVLRLGSDVAARHAAREYALHVQAANPQLAADLRERCDQYDNDRFDIMADLRAAIALVEKYADCGDNSCHFMPRGGGMRTNGGCRCSTRPFVMSALARLYKVAREACE